MLVVLQADNPASRRTTGSKKSLNRFDGWYISQALSGSNQFTFLLQTQVLAFSRRTTGSKKSLNRFDGWYISKALSGSNKFTFLLQKQVLAFLKEDTLSL